MKGRGRWQNNVGRFSISDIVFEDLPEVQRMFAQLKFLPTRVEHDYSSRSFEYKGHSPYFDEVGMGEIIPHYHIIETSHIDKDNEYIFERAEAS